jgi:hypothetical protein
MNNAGKIQNEWKIVLSSWIVQDGNYDDFEAGQHREFALEFYSEAYRKSEVREKSAESLGAGKYKIVGEVVYLTSEVWALDFGICAFQESGPAEGVDVGSFVAAGISLGIDPFDYFERLCKLSGMPPLIYSWKINSIARQTAPFIELRDSSGRKVMARDEKKLGCKIISKTDAWKDDDGNAEFFLSCIRLDVPPKSKIYS